MKAIHSSRPAFFGRQDEYALGVAGHTGKTRPVGSDEASILHTTIRTNELARYSGVRAALAATTHSLLNRGDRTFQYRVEYCVDGLALSYLQYMTETSSAEDPLSRPARFGMLAPGAFPSLWSLDRSPAAKPSPPQLVLPTCYLCGAAEHPPWLPLYVLMDELPEEFDVRMAPPPSPGVLVLQYVRGGAAVLEVTVHKESYKVLGWVAHTRDATGGPLPVRFEVEWAAAGESDNALPSRILVFDMRRAGGGEPLREVLASEWTLVAHDRVDYPDGCSDFVPVLQGPAAP